MLLRITVLLFLLSFTSHLYAQETTSEIQGIVKDDKGNGLQGATILATHLPTGTSYSTSSRKDGYYNLANVRVGGPYEITVSFIGFGSERQSDIVLTLGTGFKADFILSPSSSSLQEVTVASRRSDRIFSKSRTGAAEIITRQQLDRLPTTNRSIQDFTRLTPTANGTSFAGRSNSFNNLTVNGASFNNTFGLSGTLGGQANAQPISIDALDQIQVNIAPYDVTLGAFTGAGINSVTKSGTNEFKGSVYYYTKSPSLTGRKVGTFKVAKQEFDYNNRGVTIGGPIIKNKLFFFISGEQDKQSVPATSFAARRGTQAAGGNISQARAEDLEALSTFLRQRYGYETGAFENYNYETNSDKITARIDFNINQKHSLNVNYYYLKSYRNAPVSNAGAPTGGRQANVTALPFQAASYLINNNFNIFIAELNSRLSNKISNKLQVGYNQLKDFRKSYGDIFPMVDIENGNGQSFTSFGYEPFTAFNSLNTDTWQFNDIVSVYKGKHTLTFGTQNTYNRFRNGFAPNYYGIYRFANLADFYAAANGATTATRYELRYSARNNGEFPYAEIGALQLGLFAQDRWNATDRLTVTAGLRADLPIFDDKFIDNTNADALVFRNNTRITTGKGPKTSVLWSPRVGFNWDVAGDKVTQLRGGLGVFSGPPPFVWISNQASNNGVDFGSFVQTSNIRFSGDVNANRPSNGAANTAYNLVVVDRDFKFPQVFRTNLAVDRKIFWDMTATVEGIFTKDINAVYHENINLPATGTPLAGSDNRIRYTATQIYGAIPAGQGGNTAARPNISDAILMKNTSKGYTYNLTLQLQRNVKNLYTMVAYTYGNSRSVNDGGSVAQDMWRYRPVSGDPNADVVSYSNFYQPHRVVAASFYRKEYAKYFATSIGFTFEAANAGTASYTYGGDVNGDGQSNDLIYVPTDINDIVLEGAGATDTRSKTVLWNQLNAYINQDPYLSGRRGQYAERNALLLPFYKRLDLNFTQDFMIKAGGKRNTLRFTADIFNFGNLVNKNWGNVQATSRSRSTQDNSVALLNFLRVETSGPNAGKPVYSFPYLDAASQTPLTSTFQKSTAASSRYQVQLGLRYIFNN